MKCLKLANMKRSNRIAYEITAADMSPLAAGVYRGNFGKIIPPPDAQNYVDALIDLSKMRSAQAIFIGSDEELPVLTKEAQRIEEESGARVITCPAEVYGVCKDKWKTYEFLKSENLSCPESALPNEKDEFIRRVGFPVIIKPREGHGSLHVNLAHDKEELRSFISAIEKRNQRPMLQEFLDAEDSEFTTGVVSDRSGISTLSSISMRRSLKFGQTYKAYVDEFPEVRRTAEIVARKLKAVGPLNLQSRIVNGASYIFEINPRFSASCPIRAMAGVNEPDITFRNQILGEDIRVDEYKSLLCLRYWNELYVSNKTHRRLSNSGKITRTEAITPDYF